MRSLVLAVVLAACGGGNAPPDVDANPLGPRCQKQLYDLCSAEHDCDSMVCQNFGDIQVCSTACTPGGQACPADKSGAPATCDNGACKPGTPNMCHLE
jgi:hypothetical protein